MTRIVRSLAELRDLTRDWRATGATIGVVPTMGALHEGHLSLVRAAQAECDRVIVTLFVNPRQFNNPEDFAKYPRTEDADAAILSPLGADVLLVPDAAEVYPPGHATTISVSGVSEPRHATQTSNAVGSVTMPASARTPWRTAAMPPAPEDSSSVTVQTTTSPASRTPRLASTSAAKTMHPTPPFMSHAPRP